MQNPHHTFLVEEGPEIGALPIPSAPTPVPEGRTSLLPEASRIKPLTDGLGVLRLMVNDSQPSGIETAKMLNPPGPGVVIEAQQTFNIPALSLEKVVPGILALCRSQGPVRGPSR